MALERAFESHRPSKSRLFSDPYADAFLRPWMRWMAAASATPILRGAATRLFDAKTGPGPRPSALVDIVDRHQQIESSQIVLLGAGFDTRAYRLTALASARVFELDHPATQRAKRRVIERLGLSGDHVTHAPIDFERDDLHEVLTSAGFDSSSPIVFVWEGVTNYLSDHAVHDTLSTIRRLSATPDAALIATYVDIRALDDPFGLHPQSATQYFHDRGYQVCRDISTKDAGQQLLRGLRRTEPGSALYGCWSPI
ncbi:MAG TPA: class I SAM-dependent methyltransferase [Mycobacterium sp.]